jgi:hypothetical protein
MQPPKTYHVQLYRDATPEEWDWDESATLAFLATRLSDFGEAQKVLAEVDEKGTATRTIDYGDGYTKAPVVVSTSPVVEPPSVS